MKKQVSLFAIVVGYHLIFKKKQSPRQIIQIHVNCIHPFFSAKSLIILAEPTTFFFCVINKGMSYH